MKYGITSMHFNIVYRCVEHAQCRWYSVAEYVKFVGFVLVLLHKKRGF